MKNRSKVAENLAKVFLNLGQGIALAGIVARLIQHQVTLIETIAVIGIGIYTIIIGLYLVSECTTSKEV